MQYHRMSVSQCSTALWYRDVGVLEERLSISSERVLRSGEGGVCGRGSRIGAGEQAEHRAGGRAGLVGPRRPQRLGGARVRGRREGKKGRLRYSPAYVRAVCSCTCSWTACRTLRSIRGIFFWKIGSKRPIDRGHGPGLVVGGGRISTE